jgi:hypothetical protein
MRGRFIGILWDTFWTLELHLFFGTEGVFCYDQYFIIRWPIFFRWDGDKTEIHLRAPHGTPGRSWPLVLNLARGRALYWSSIFSPLLPRTTASPPSHPPRVRFFAAAPLLPSRRGGRAHWLPTGRSLPVPLASAPCQIIVYEVRLALDLCFS